MIKTYCDGCGVEIIDGRSGGLPILRVNSRSEVAVRFAVISGPNGDQHCCNACVLGRVRRWAASVAEQEGTVNAIGERSSDVRCLVLDLQGILRQLIAGKIGRDGATLALCKKVDALAEFLL